MGSKNVVVSVCVVSYNNKEFIAKCLESIFSQKTNFYFEVIVSDDCSTDGTIEIINDFKDKYGSQCVVVENPVNIGAYRNYIETHARAIGEFVCHCDGDDYFLPGKLQRQFDYFQQNPACSVVWHSVSVLKPSGGMHSWAPKFLSEQGGVIQISQVLRIGSIAAHSSQMYRRSARHTLQPEFDVLDIFYSIEYLRSGYGYYISENLGVYRLHSTNSISSSKSGYKKIRHCYSEHLMYFLHCCPELRKDIFIGAMVNFFLDIKLGKIEARYFLKVLLCSISRVSMAEVLAAIKQRKSLRMSA